MFPHLPVHNLWWLAAGGAGAAARFVQLRKRPLVVTRFVDEEPTDELLRLQESHGYNAHSLVSIAVGARLWSCPQIAGGIAYNEFGKVWLVPGDPLASPDNVAELTSRFIDAAREQGRVVAFMPSTERFALLAEPLGLRAVKVGAAPYFDLTTWGPRGDRAKKARAGVNQARRAGVRVTKVDRVDERLTEETAALCERWLKTRRSAMKFGWLFAVDLFQHAERKRFFAARDTSGNLVGFLAASPIPAREGWYLEDVVRLPGAPSGTADLLVVEALNLLKRDGAKLATLGTSPLARDGSIDPGVRNNELVANGVRIVTKCFAGFYNFEGLRRFKVKFAPSWWESEYILFSRDATAPPRIITAFIQAIAPDGASNLIARQVSRALRPTRSERAKNKREHAVSLASGVHGPLIASSSIMNQEIIRNEIAQPVVEFGPEPASARHYLGQFVSVNGQRLHYVSKGLGRPVVFIHGNPGSHQDYSMGLLGRVAQSYRAFAFDRPGHGYSERPNGADATVEVQACLLREALHKLSIEKPLLVGHSWGGALALAAALKYEDELSGLVLLAPAAYPSASNEWWTVVPRIPWLGNLLVKIFAPLIGRGIIKESLKEAYHPEQVQKDYMRSAAMLWTRPEQVKACAADDRSLNDSLKVLSERYADIRLPVVIVAGDSDLLLEPKSQFHRLHQTIPGSELIVLQRTGHQIPQTRPQSVINAIELGWELAARR
jgi:pimeloyl-ACP methyl ester carboxylesterase